MKIKSDRTVTIIGGGVIGAACAYQLAREKRQVTIIDRSEFGKGSSYGNCGLIIPSHILPLNIPGTFFKAIKWTLSKEAPLYVKPTLNPDTWIWFLKFLKRCNQEDLMEAATGRFDLLKDAIALFDEFITTEKIQCDWQKKGILYLFESKAEMDAYKPFDQLIRQFLDDGNQLGTTETLELESTLSDHIAGSWYYQNGAHLRPDYLMSEYKRVLTKMGVRIIENETIDGFNIVNKRMVSVQSRHNQYESEQFLVTTGAWTNKIRRQLNIPASIQPGKGYSVTTPSTQNQVGIPCLLEDIRVVATPWESGLRLGGMMEFSGFDDHINQNRINCMKTGAQKYFKKELQMPAIENWSGWRPMTYTGLPIIDFVPAAHNAVLAAGHNMLGLSMALSTAKIVTSLLGNRKPNYNLNFYRVR